MTAGGGGPYLLAVDAGTGSCRALLFTAAGEQAAVSLREWSHREPPGVPGGQDFDVEVNWLAITACIRDALRLAGATGDQVAAVAATSMREGIVLYDAGGRELWACPNVDSRAAREAAELIAEGAADRIFAEAGDWVSITSPARLRWLARHDPGLLRQVSSVGMLSDWIVWRLARVHVTEPSCGSSSGMFSLARRTWSADIAISCGLSSQALPEVADPGTELADDLARVEAVRDAVGASGRVRVDANGAWSVDEAVSAIVQLDRAAGGLEYVEQPCAAVEDLAAVRRKVDVPIAADESIRRAEDPYRVRDLEAADVAVLKVQPLGGVRACLRIAEDIGLPVVVSSALETSLGLAAGVALAAALPTLEHACGLATRSLLTADVAMPELGRPHVTSGRNQTADRRGRATPRGTAASA